MDFGVKVGGRDPQHVLEKILVQKISKFFDDFFSSKFFRIFRIFKNFKFVFFFEIFQNFQNFKKFKKFQVREKSLVVLNGIVGCFKRNLF